MLGHLPSSSFFPVQTHLKSSDPSSSSFLNNRYSQVVESGRKRSPLHPNFTHLCDRYAVTGYGSLVFSASTSACLTALHVSALECPVVIRFHCINHYPPLFFGFLCLLCRESVSIGFVSRCLLLLKPLKFRLWIHWKDTMNSAWLPPFSLTLDFLGSKCPVS